MLEVAEAELAAAAGGTRTTNGASRTIQVPHGSTTARVELMPCSNSSTSPG